MNKDKPLIAALFGAIATLPGEALSLVLLVLGVSEYSIYQVDSLLVTFNRPTEFIGLIVNFIVGGLAGVIFYYALNMLGEDYLVLKGLAFGCMFWLLTELAFTTTVEGKYIPLRLITDYNVHILDAAIFGSTLVLLINKYLLPKPNLH